MDKLTYGTYNGESMGDYAFSATNNYTNPASESETRKQLSYPLYEIQEFLDDTMPIKVSDNKVVQLGVSSQGKLMYRSVAGGSWTDITGGIPYGGTEYRALIKKSSSDYDVGYGMPSYVGMVIMNTFSTESDVKAVYGSNTSWALRSSVILSSEHVYGNGKSLGLTSGSGVFKGLEAVNGEVSNHFWGVNNCYGSDVGKNNGTLGSGSFTHQKGVGVPTKTQISEHEGDSADNTGLVADTYTIYTWERTA